MLTSRSITKLAGQISMNHLSSIFYRGKPTSMIDRSKRKESDGDWTQSNLDQLSQLRLWRAVLAQAARDLVFGNIAQRRESVVWAKRISPDFDMVCDLCGLDQERTHKLFMEMVYPEEAYSTQNKLLCSSARKRQVFLYNEFLSYVHKHPTNILYDPSS